GSSRQPSAAVEQQSDKSSDVTNQTNSSSDSNQAQSNNHGVRTPILPPPPPGDTLEKPGADYFNFRGSRLDQEPNPFEQSFSVNGTENTPKAILPPASAIQSPAPLIGAGYSFHNSLRNGPLSPAMLQGPISSNGALGFDSHIRSGLTPNESGIRSGLTPGGSGSMFPVPSPSPASFLQFGTSTPSTMEFQKTALSALSKQHQRSSLSSIPPMLTKPEFAVPQNDDRDHTGNPSVNKSRQLSNNYDTDSAHHAANGLFMLAQAHQSDQFAPQNNNAPSNNPANVQPQITMVPPPTDSSPNSKKRSIVTNASMSRGPNMSNIATTHNISNHAINHNTNHSNNLPPNHPTNHSTNHMANNIRGMTSARARKNDSKSNNKRAKISQGSVGPGSGDDQDPDNQLNENGKKMTDEEKRKNFLERNRVAALKCRQRKKQWLQNLQSKVEYYSQENDALTTQVASLREEIVALKTLLLAHKDCPISRSSMGIDPIHNALAGSTDYGNHQYAPMGVMPSSPAVHGHPRRYS
ncbi:Aft1 HRA domain-containing protein, partial [Peziza echinospora]